MNFNVFTTTSFIFSLQLNQHFVKTVEYTFKKLNIPQDEQRRHCCTRQHPHLKETDLEEGCDHRLPQQPAPTVGLFSVFRKEPTNAAFMWSAWFLLGIWFKKNLYLRTDGTLVFNSSVQTAAYVTVEHI